MKMLKDDLIHIFGILLLAMCCVFIGGGTVLAAGNPSSYYLPEMPKTESAVNDFAGLYTEEEIASFEEKMRNMSQEYDCNVVAVILDNDERNSSELSAPEKFSEAFLNLDGPKSTVVLWLNVSRANRAMCLLGYGSAEGKITSSEADEIVRDLRQYVIDYQSSAYSDRSLYVNMMNEFIEITDTEMRRPYFFLTWWFHLALGVLLGLIVVLVLVKNSGGKMTATARTYLNETLSGLLGRRDIYTHTTYVRTRKSSSSGGGGGGGHSHSSGGGRF